MAINNLDLSPIESRSINDLTEYQENIFKASLGLTEVPKKAPERGLMVGNASLASLVFRKLNWLYKEIFVDTANDESLAKKGEAKGIYKSEGVEEIFTATLEGADNVTVGTRFEYDTYVYTVSSIIDSSTVKLISSGNGVEYNRIVGDELNIVQNIATVGDTLVITSINQVSTDDETTDEYNARVIVSEQSNPQGGNSYSYLLWTIEVLDVIDAYVNVDDAGVVSVMGIGSGDDGDRILDVDKRLEIQESIEQSPGSSCNDRRPANDKVEIIEGTSFSVTIEISNWYVDDEDLKDSIESSLRKYLNSLRALNESTGKFSGNSAVNKSTIETIVNALTINSEYEFNCNVSINIGGTSITNKFYLPQYSLASLGSISYAE